MSNNREVDTLVAQLDSLSRKKQQAAYDYIRDLPDGEAIEIIAAISQRRPTLKTVLKRTSVNLHDLGLMVAFSFLITMLLDDTQREKALLALFVVVAYLFYYIPRQTHLIILQHQLYLQLPRYRDARFAVYALKLFPNSYGSAERELKKSLERNLPLLTKEIAQGLTIGERTTLRGPVLLSHPKLDVVVLETLARIEDTAAIPTIERMFRHEKDENVKAVAEACLAKLREVKIAEKASKVLLRPSHNRDDKTLLRIPQEGARPFAKQEQELLRPDSKDKIEQTNSSP